MTIRTSVAIDLDDLTALFLVVDQLIEFTEEPEVAAVVTEAFDPAPFVRLGNQLLAKYQVNARRDTDGSTPNTPRTIQ